MGVDGSFDGSFALLWEFLELPWEFLVFLEHFYLNKLPLLGSFVGVLLNRGSFV